MSKTDPQPIATSNPAGGSAIRGAVFRIVLAYVVFAAVWITFSDQLVIKLFSDPQRIALVSTLKGYVFILLTASLLAIMVHRSLKAQADESRKLQIMMQLASDGIQILDLKGDVVQVNEHFCRMLGYSVEEMLGMNVCDWDPAMTPAQTELAVAQLVITRELRTFETRNLRRDGHQLDVEVSAAAVEVGGRTFIYCVSHDITQRKMAEQSLRESEARFRHMFANAIDGILLGTPDGNVYDANAAACRMLGLTRNEIVQGGRHALTDPADPAIAAAVHHRETHGSFHGDLTFVRKDGTRFPAEVTSVTFPGIGGRTEVSVTMRDITERTNRESEIRKLSLALQQSPQSIAITDLEARIEYVNDAFLRVTGYSREEAIGSNPRILQSGKTPRQSHLDMWAALLRGDTWEGEFINRRKDGSEYIEAVKMAPVRQDDGRITHYLAIKDDITEQKRMAQELAHYRSQLEELVKSRTAELAAATQRADDANAAKSMFLANMSHEIRTPLNAIHGLSYLLLQSQLSAQQRDRLQKIDQSSRHLRLLIDDILDLSKIEAGKLIIERAPFNLRATVTEAFEISGSRAREKGVSISTLIDDRLPVWVEGDALRLRQVLLNLGSNAAKFTERGTIAFRASLEAQGPPALVRFEVEDTGIGISASDQAKLFQHFQQADASTTRRFGGTGLGLAISAKLVQLMGGSIGLQSREGAGSTFWVTLPVVPVDEQVIASSIDVTGTGAASYRRLTVLLVEDDPINQEVARELLVAVGHQVEIAGNGAEALRCAERSDFDVVLMDMQMPVMDGVTAASRLRAMPGYASTPIIAMTANAFAEDRQRCLDAGMTDFIAKPFNPAVLYERLNTLVAAAAPARPAAPAPAQPVAAAQGGEQDGLLARIAHIDGMDIATGFALVTNPAVYEKLLRMYVEHHAADGDMIRSQLSQGKIEDAIRCAHTLKGSAAIIGAIGIRAGAEKLEQAMHAGVVDPRELEPAIAELEQQNSRLLASLTQALDA